MVNRLLYNDKIVGARGILTPYGTHYDVSFDTLFLLRQDFELKVTERPELLALSLISQGDLLVAEDGSTAEELTYGGFAVLLNHNRLANTDEKLKKLYNYYNKLYFDNTLPQLIPVEWSTRMKGAAGRFNYTRYNRNMYKNFSIKLSVSYHQQYPDQVISTLVHEMIHVLYPAEAHGSKFKAMMAFLNSQYGLSINVYADYTEKNYVYECLNCGIQFERVRKVNTRSRRCASCLGHLSLILDRTGDDEDAVVFTDMSDW